MYRWCRGRVMCRVRGRVSGNVRLGWVRNRVLD